MVDALSSDTLSLPISPLSLPIGLPSRYYTYYSKVIILKGKLFHQVFIISKWGTSLSTLS